MVVWATNLSFPNAQELKVSIRVSSKSNICKKILFVEMLIISKNYFIVPLILICVAIFPNDNKSTTKTFTTVRLSALRRWKCRFEDYEYKITKKNVSYLT